MGFGVMLLSSPVVGADQLISGIYQKGSNITEPKPQSDQILKTHSGGFGVRDENNEAVYVLNVDIIKPYDRTMYVKAEFQNPLNLDHPFVEQTEIPAGQSDLRLVYGPVKGLKIHRSYWVRILIYELVDKDKPVEVFLQHIKSYIDNTGPELILKSGLKR